MPDVDDASAPQAVTEVNFDGLPGPTHNYSGLATGNLAANRSKNLVADPREAALQSLAKMKSLADAGYAQAILPPHERPDVGALRALGFAGSDAAIVAHAGRLHPQLLEACSSAAAMWVANAATVSPSADTVDGRIHFTPANLVSHFHRAIETPTTARMLRAIFCDESRFAVHGALPASMQFADEGAANHMRLFTVEGNARVELFVYGRDAFDASALAPRRFTARQTRQACEAIARTHGLDASRTLFAQQLPEAIDAGVFHNDVIAVANANVLFCHERAFIDQPALLAALDARLGAAFTSIVVTEREIGLDQAVATYLFNSQLLTRTDGAMQLIAPAECRKNPDVAAYLRRLLDSGGPIVDVQTFDLRQSMRNGGGPACLRLRVVMTPAEQAAINANVWLDELLYVDLRAWVGRHYRDRLAPADLADPTLLDESRRALDELSRLLRLGDIYTFQRV